MNRREQPAPGEPSLLTQPPRCRTHMTEMFWHVQENVWWCRECAQEANGQVVIPVPAQPEGGEKPQVCHNPNHFHTDGSPSEHEIGSSCMAEPSSPSAQAGEKHTLTALEVVTYHPETYVLINEHDGTRWRGKAGEARRGTWVVVEVENREPLA